MKNLILNTIRIRPSRTEQECIELMPSQGLLWIKDENGVGGHYSELSGYNYIFTDEDTQEDIYTKSARPMVERFLSGINTAVLAYGQVSIKISYYIKSKCKFIIIIYIININIIIIIIQSGSGKKYSLDIDFEEELEKGFSENTGNLINY